MHCFGSVITFGALLSGRLTGKIRSMVCTQLSATPQVDNFNNLKLGLYIPGTLEALGVPGLSPSKSLGKLTDHLLNTFAKDISQVFIPYEERCHNHVCHR